MGVQDDSLPARAGHYSIIRRNSCRRLEDMLATWHLHAFIKRLNSQPLAQSASFLTVQRLTDNSSPVRPTTADQRQREQHCCVPAMSNSFT